MSEIPDYPNYLIYRDGRVWGVKRRKFKTSHILRNYERIALCKDGKNKFFYIHRLLALTYIPNPENKPHVDHIDRNTRNNNLDNLRWATREENMVNRKVTGKINERFIKLSNKNHLEIHIRINSKTKFCKKSKYWTLEQAVNARNIVLKFLKFSTKVD